MSEHNNSLSLPEFEQRLWAELEALHPDGASGGSARAMRSSTRRRYLAAVAVLALAGGIAVAALLASQDSQPTNVAGRSEGSADEAGVSTDDGASSETGAGVEIDRERPPDAIVRVEQINDNGWVDQRWTDETTGLMRNLLLDPSGDPRQDSGWSEMEPAVECEAVHEPPPEGGCSRVTQVSVDHAQGTYTTNEMVMPDRPRESWREDDSVIRWLREGTLREDGTEEVDGRELLRFLSVIDPTCIEEEIESRVGNVGESPTSTVATAPTTTVAAESSLSESCVGEEIVDGILWVDPETYRPVKRLGYPDRPDLGFSAGPEDGAYTQTYEYLERTPENLGLLEVQIPDGFVEQ